MISTISIRRTSKENYKLRNFKTREGSFSINSIQNDECNECIIVKSSLTLSYVYYGIIIIIIARDFKFVEIRRDKMAACVV